MTALSERGAGDRAGDGTMNYESILLLAVRAKTGGTVSGHDFRAPLLAKKCHFLDYIDVYEKYGYKGAQDFISGYIRTNKIKCLVNISSSAEFYFDLDFFERLGKEVFIVRCIGDTEHFYDVSEQYYCQTADLVVSDFAGICRLKQLGVNYYFCPGAYDTARYSNKKLPKDIDVAFVGQICDKMDRMSYLRYLLDNGINVKVYGRGSKNGVVSFEEKLNIYNRSKIVLSMTGVAEITRLTRKYNIHRRLKAIKDPLMEGLMCGSFVLTEAAPYIDELFEIGKEVEVFHGKKEMLDKIRYYLANDAAREEIALRGYNKLKEKRYFDVELHLPRIMAKIDELALEKPSSVRQPVYVDDVLLTNFSTFRVLMLIRFLKRLEPGKAFEELMQIFKYRRIDLYQVRIFLIEEILDLYPKLKNLLKGFFGDVDEKRV